jgi:hypothetical protein
VQDAAVGLENLGAAQGDPVKQLSQVQGGTDGHADGVKGVQLGDALLGLQGDLTAPQGAGNLPADHGEEIPLLIRNLPGLCAQERQNAVKEDVVENGKEGQKAKSRQGLGEGRLAGKLGVVGDETGLAGADPRGPLRGKLRPGEKPARSGISNEAGPAGDPTKRGRRGQGEMVGQHVHQVSAAVHFDRGVGDLDDPGQDLEGLHVFA